MTKEDDKGFEVTDKRRKTDAGADEKMTEPEAPETEPTEGKEEVGEQQETAEASEKEAEHEPIPPMMVGDLVAVFINQFSALAWQRMGLMPDTLSGKIEKDLDQARLAIDCTAALVEKISPSVSEEERRDLQILVSNLRVNYVRQQ